MSTKQQTGGRPSKRDYILSQAEVLVREKGASQLTFDALTEVTGISKGGLLYHFASKDALITAMLQRYISHKQRSITELLDAGAVSGNDIELKALIMSHMNETDGELAVSSAILAAVASNPSLLTPIHSNFEEVCDKLEQSEAGALPARVAWLAAMGYRLMRQIGIIEARAEDNAELQDFLLTLLDAKTQIIPGEQTREPASSVNRTAMAADG